MKRSVLLVISGILFQVLGAVIPVPKNRDVDWAWRGRPCR